MQVDWLLDCEPREVQLEALRRSMLGICTRDHRDQEPYNTPVYLPHAPGPAYGWAHFLDMRLGKTPVALNEYLLFKRDHGARRLLVITPNRYKATWGEEVVKFGVDVQAYVYPGRKKGRAGLVDFANKNGEGIVIIHYEALQHEADVKTLAEHWVDETTVIVADESVIIKNHQSTMFSNAMALAKDAMATRAMTGLPTPQAPYDAWAQLRFARQLNGFNYYAFKHKFTKMGGFKGKQPKGFKNREEFDALLQDCAFRALRVDWGTKIGSTYETARLDMPPELQKAYNEMEDEFVTWLNEGQDAVTAEQVITKHMKLQQISSGFIYDEYRAVHWLTEFTKTPKYIDLIDRLSTEVPGKLIIIALHRPVIEALYTALQPYGATMIAGQAMMREYGLDDVTEKERFNHDPASRVIIGQSKAIKYGHTLMGNAGDPCQSLVFFENTYSLDDRRQGEERPQGEGQQAAIHIWDYALSPAEANIAGALQRKGNVADAIMRHYQAPPL